jgi:hypothetical protein
MVFASALRSFFLVDATRRCHSATPRRGVGAGGVSTAELAAMSAFA